MSPLLAYHNDITDRAELEKDRHAPDDILIVNYKSLTNYPVKEKGIFVDIWI